MQNCWRKCEIARKYMKITQQLLANIAEQIITTALATHVEGVRIDICCSQLLFIPCMTMLTLHTIKLIHNVDLHIMAPFVFPWHIWLDYDIPYLVQCFSSVFGMWPNCKIHRSMCPGCMFFLIFMSDLKKLSK